MLEKPQHIEEILERLKVQQITGEEDQDHCVYCFVDLSESESYKKFRICHNCNFHYSLSAWERIHMLVDKGAFQEKYQTLVSMDPISFSEGLPYEERLNKERERTGLSDALVVGIGKIGGNQAMIAVLDFGFLGGSMGVVVGEKMALAIEMAIDKHLPVVAITTSGGTRLQEGVLSLMQMAKTAEVAKELHKQGLPFISVLANPTTGEVYASFANLADVIIGEPGALIGFAPMREMESNSASPVPSSSHSAESHLEHGMLDMVVPRPQLHDKLAILLGMLNKTGKRYKAKKSKLPKFSVSLPKSAWKNVQLARDKERPTSQDYLSRIFTDFTELHGDRLFGDDRAVMTGVAYLGAFPVAVVALERGKKGETITRHDGRAYPEGFRKAQRVMQMAAKFRLPLITLIDTPGAHPGLESEERGVGIAIATTLSMMSDLPTPIITVFLGEGGSEGALALSVADKILMLENSILSPITPERAATLIYRDNNKAEDVAESLKLTAYDCKELGIVDMVVPEPDGDAHADVDKTAKILQDSLTKQLSALLRMPLKKLLKKRYGKFRRIGERSTYYKKAARKEVSRLRRLARRWRRRGNGPVRVTPTTEVVETKEQQAPPSTKKNAS